MLALRHAVLLALAGDLARAGPRDPEAYAYPHRPQIRKRADPDPGFARLKAEQRAKAEAEIPDKYLHSAARRRRQAERTDG